MGLGIDLAREHAPEHAAALDNLKDQLLIAMVVKAGGTLSLPCADIDATGAYTLAFRVDANRVFHFTAAKKS